MLQVDDPLLASYYVMHPEASVEECRKWAAGRVDVLNHALRGLPADRIRYHTCYSINIGPRVHDMELKHLIDVMLRVNAGAYSFEAANPRHEHEWRVWQEVKLPEGKSVIPGVITHSSDWEDIRLPTWKGRDTQSRETDANTTVAVCEKVLCGSPACGAPITVNPLAV